MNKKEEKNKGEKKALDRDLNPGPLAPEARIIPLDHRAPLCMLKYYILYWKKSAGSKIQIFFPLLAE